jgi:hypothetical protein
LVPVSAYPYLEEWAVRKLLEVLNMPNLMEQMITDRLTQGIQEGWVAERREMARVVIRSRFGEGADSTGGADCPTGWRRFASLGDPGCHCRPDRGYVGSQTGILCYPADLRRYVFSPLACLTERTIAAPAQGRDVGGF